MPRSFLSLSLFSLLFSSLPALSTFSRVGKHKPRFQSVGSNVTGFLWPVASEKDISDFDWPPSHVGLVPQPGEVAWRSGVLDKVSDVIKHSAV